MWDAKVGGGGTELSAEDLGPWFAAFIVEFVLFGVVGTLPINARVIYTLYAVKQERAIEQTAMFAQSAEQNEPGSDRDLVVLPEAMLAELEAFLHVYAASSTPHCPTLFAGYLCGWGRTARPGRAGSGWLPPRAAAPSCCSTERSTAGSRPTWPPYGPAGTGSRGSHPASPMSALRRVRRVHLRVHQSQVSSYRVNVP